MTNQGDDLPEPASLRLLRRLVTTLLGVMIVAVIAVVALMALRLTAAPPLTLPDDITLPDGAVARAVTFGQGWVAVVTQADRILVFDTRTGDLRDSLTIAPAR